MSSDFPYAKLSQKGNQYFFTAKHHGAGPNDAAQWAVDLSYDEEFSVFDASESHGLADADGNLFGSLRTRDNLLRDLGTWGQQIAKFPFASINTPWHGYPLWAINADGPSHRGDQKMRPAREVFQKMEAVGLLTPRERKRLSKGQHA